jgi:hypothetical protein
MLPSTTFNHSTSDRTISDAHQSALIRMVVYLRLKFSIKIAATPAK